MESTIDVSELTERRPSGAAARPCRLLVSAPADGATNMAMDEALLLRARRTGETLYRVYSWTPATVSLGRNQSARGCYDLDLARARGIEFVRRPTGGRAILHHREITYSIAGPVATFGSLRESYRAINRLLLEVLRTLGVDAQEAEPPSRSPFPGLAPCFEAPVAGELVAAGRKLVGSAQMREGNVFLQHGSILIDDDQHLLAELLNSGDRPSPAATLRALTGRAVTVEEFAVALRQALTARQRGALHPSDFEESLLEEVQSLVRTRYAVADWTWRR